MEGGEGKCAPSRTLATRAFQARGWNFSRGRVKCAVLTRAWADCGHCRFSLFRMSEASMTEYWKVSRTWKNLDFILCYRDISIFTTKKYFHHFIINIYSFMIFLSRCKTYMDANEDIHLKKQSQYQNITFPKKLTQVPQLASKQSQEGQSYYLTLFDNTYIHCWTLLDTNA